MARGGHGKTASRSKHLANPQLRRRLSEEGKRLLWQALAHEDDQGSVDFSIITNRDESSASSDLESVLEWEQNENGARGGLNGDGGAAGSQQKKRTNKWKAQQYGGAHHERDEELETAIDELMEKRDTTKIQALRKIIRLLCGSVMTASVQSSKVTLTSNILACLKKRMKDSGTLALRSLGVLATTLGSDEQEFFDGIVCVYANIRAPLQRILTDEGDPALRVEAVYALSIACFVCCREDQQKWKLVDVLGHLLTASKDADEEGDEYPESLIIAVLECWAFLISTFRSRAIVPKIYDGNSIIYDHVAAISGFAREGVNPSVRSAACEVLALLVQCKYEVSSQGDDGDDTWCYTDEDPDSSLIGGLDTKIERYMKETGKSIGKKNRKVQRSSLKEVLETLRTGEGPHEELQIEDETLSISTWRCFFQVHVFRHVLQSGFQVHMVENDVLRDVFDVSESKTAVKMSMVSTSKQRANHKSKAVSKRNEVSRKGMAQNAFLFED
ncbi:Interferon-related developmental regulator 1, partial [Globisporangium splendens]